MLRLTDRQSQWLAVWPGVRIEFRPIDSKAWRAAKRAAGLASADAEGDEDERIEHLGDAFSRALIQRGIAAWEGVGDADGNPVEPSPEWIEQLLADPRLFEAIDLAYVMPFALEHQEGNVSAGSPNGTSVGATPAIDTASSPAGAVTTDAAAPAPTASTASARKRAKGSGKS